tara:strand:- start:244 stop:504 length:261 start_codon:yes stop_codon:yes gene_type:complete
MMEVDSARLQRVESKIDDLQKAVIVLAQVEVKIETIFSRQTKIENKVNQMDESIRELTSKADNRFSERIFWIIVCAAIGVAVRMFS